MMRFGLKLQNRPTLIIYTCKNGPRIVIVIIELKCPTIHHIVSSNPSSAFYIQKDFDNSKRNNQPKMYLKSILHFHRVIEKENFFWRIRTAALIAVFTQTKLCSC